MSIASRARQATHRLKSLLGKESANYPRIVSVAGANQQTIDFIRTTKSKFIAELGIYEGHTSIEFARHLNGEGELHLYDYEDRVKAVARTIGGEGFQNVHTFGCSYKLLDSYNWQLSKQIERYKDPIYDYVFIDGAHTWAVDALAFFLVDRLLKVGGYIDFDDWNWSLKGSPALNPHTFPLTRRLYTQEQIDSRQIRMIGEIIVRRDHRYKEVVTDKIFQKIA